MEKKASELLGEPVAAGAILVPKGHTAAAVQYAIGGVTGQVLSKAVGEARQPASIPGDIKGPIYLAAGSTKVGLCSTKTGLISMSPDKLLIQYPRSDVRGVEIGGGLVPEVQFILRDGTTYLFECPRAYLGGLKRVQKLLATQ